MRAIVLLLLCAILDNSIVFSKRLQDVPNTYEALFEWPYLNFTWDSAHIYGTSVQSKAYIPEAVTVTSIRIYDDKIYMALPRMRKGVPATLAWMNLKSEEKSPLLTPFPSWRHHDLSKCENFQSVHGLEIDENGMMWVIDSGRSNRNHLHVVNTHGCDPALFMIDMRHEPPRVVPYRFQSQIANRDSILNDIVIDRYDEGYAYITDARRHDPGIIIYSRKNDRTWRFKHHFSMTASKGGVNFDVNDFQFKGTFNLHGIALGPQYFNKHYRLVRNVYYSSGSSNTVYATSSEVLWNNSYSTLSWSRQEKLATKVGVKYKQSFGMMMDEDGYMYYGLHGLHEVDRWKDRTIETNSRFRIWDDDADEVFVDNRQNKTDKSLAWIHNFAIDLAGVLYMLSNNYHLYVNNKIDTNVINYRILTTRIGVRSYLYGKDFTHLKEAFSEREHSDGSIKLYCPKPGNSGQPTCLCSNKSGKTIQISADANPYTYA